MAWAIVFIPLTIYVSLLSDDEQHMQQTSFEILCGCLIVFFFFGNITLMILSYLRRRGNSIVMIALEQAKFVPIVSLFFSGLLYHVFVGLFRHMFDMSAEWGATTKEMDNVEFTLSLFFSEVWDTFKRFWFMYICIVLYSLGWALVYLVGPGWMEWNGFAMAPFICMIVSHFFMPILLNPNAMYGLYYGLRKALCCCGTKTATGKDEAKKELQDDDNSITFAWPDEDLESGNIFEFDLLQGETEHTKKSTWSNYVNGGMDGATEHTHKSRTSKSAADAGMRGETEHTRKSSTSKHTNKSRSSKSLAHAGMHGETEHTHKSRSSKSLGHAGMDGKTEHTHKSSTSKHTNKSRTSKSAAHAGMDGETQHTHKSSTSKHTNKSRTSKSAAHAGMDGSVNKTPSISGPLRQRRLSRDFDDDSFDAVWNEDNKP
jgi:hypothetical protein